MLLDVYEYKTDNVCLLACIVLEPAQRNNNACVCVCVCACVRVCVCVCVCVHEPAFEMYISKNAGLCLLIIIRYKVCTLPPHMATVFYLFAASACLSYDIEEGASAKNSEVNCSPGSAGIINCTVTCKDNFAFQDGTTTMSYDCQGSNEWQPALPAQSCVRKLASLSVCVCVCVCV